MRAPRSKSSGAGSQTPTAPAAGGAPTSAPGAAPSPDGSPSGASGAEIARTLAAHVGGGAAHVGRIAGHDGAAATRAVAVGPIGVATYEWGTQTVELWPWSLAADVRRTRRGLRSLTVLELGDSRGSIAIEVEGHALYDEVSHVRLAASGLLSDPAADRLERHTGQARRRASRSDEDPLTRIAIVATPLHPRGYVERGGCLEPAVWVSAGPPPSVGHRVAIASRHGSDVLDVTSAPTPEMGIR